ncbi:MAG TPA: cell division protein FtsZ, partial [Candidatus Babeliales bacterium]|nr:cell division protein FtsZ [Candidatus Babeliales bacterium]
MLAFAEEHNQLGLAKIKVLGVGGAGGNAVNSMLAANQQDIEFIVANTDAQALLSSQALHKLQLGIKATKGLGTGANPELGRQAAEEDLEQILAAVAGADIVFLTAGMGGGTGSGATPVIARALRAQGILTVAVVTKPFNFEGKRRARIAAETIQRLKAEVDTLIILPNQKLLEHVGDDVTMVDAFALINNVLNQAVRSISDIIVRPGHINVDFADLRTIMHNMGVAVMGTGVASGPERALTAALHAISSPILENVDIRGAKSVLLNITGGADLTLHEINVAASVIYEQADPDANIIIGSVVDEQLAGEIAVSLIATGFDQAVTATLMPAVDLTVPVNALAGVGYEPYPVSSADSLTAAVSCAPAESEQRDNLDVPAFLRRKNNISAT